MRRSNKGSQESPHKGLTKQEACLYRTRMVHEDVEANAERPAEGDCEEGGESESIVAPSDNSEDVMEKWFASGGHSPPSSWG